MENKKLSSVEWLEQELKKIPFVNVLEVFEQAKAMHKEEMKQTYFDGWHRNIGNRDEDFDDYYNETFGGNNEDTN